MKPNLFIGSSSEGLDFAYALQQNLENVAEVTVWPQDVFKPGEFMLESLLNHLTGTDFGVFVLSMDDVLSIRGEEHSVARDNVIFEFGLFLGKLGRRQCVIVAARGKSWHMPSDFLGLNVLSFDAERSDKNWRASLGPAAHEINKMLSKLVPNAAKLPEDLGLSMLERRDRISNTQRNLLFAIEVLVPINSVEAAALIEDIPEPELYYRLEQLRLLMFLSKKDGKFDLTDEYRKIKGPDTTASSSSMSLEKIVKPLSGSVKK